jgi:hypothetical protein
MAQPEESSLTILSLAEPLLTVHGSVDTLTKSSLDAELDHYKDLFSKLRFSYVEQVTKENFLKAIVAKSPQLVDAADNALLEQHLAQAKAQGQQGPDQHKSQRAARIGFSSGTM